MPGGREGALKAITLRLEECTHERLVVDKVRRGGSARHSSLPLWVHVRALGFVLRARGGFKQRSREMELILKGTLAAENGP